MEGGYRELRVGERCPGAEGAADSSSSEDYNFTLSIINQFKSRNHSNV